ncbi:MAG: TIGR03016 family PEP-CTERM system-associated outer membrane protein [Burkholderiales bacterium]
MAKARSDAQRRRQASPGGADARHHLKRFLSLSAALPALLSCPAWAAKWEIVPTLSAGETYTDNVSLTPDAVKQGDWVTQVSPGISIAATGTRLRFNAAYAPEAIYHARGQTEYQTYQRLHATGQAELAKQLLFVDAGVTVDQANISLRGPIAESNVNATGNRTTTKTFFVSPYLLRDFGSAVRAEARLTHSVANSDNTTVLSDSEANRINLRLANGPAYKLLTWNLDYRRETINYESLPDIDIETITANARRLVTPTVGLLAKVGYENYDSLGTKSELKGSSWGTGLDWTPTPRTRAAATVGQRFYGKTYNIDFSHRTRLTTWSAGYGEDITTTRSDFFIPVTTSTAGYLDTLFLTQFPDPVARQKAVEEFIARTGLPPSLTVPVNFFSNQLFLVKRWQASTSLLGVRNVLLANVFRETREVFGSLVAPGVGDFASSNTIRQTGASFIWNWRVTSRNAWNLGAVRTRREFPDIARVDDLTEFRMGLTRQFRPRLSGALNYRRQQIDSNQSAFSYTENAASATLQMRF